jgi:hypothetical protein
VTEEGKRVLEMLVAGQINTDEADRLLQALRDGPEGRSHERGAPAGAAVPARDGRFQ